MEFLTSASTGRRFHAARMYGTSISRALKRTTASIPEAARAMGYKGPDMLYRILRDDADPSLDALQKLADFVNEPIGDLLPNSGSVSRSDELRDILAAISGVSGDARADVIHALAINARVLANAYRRDVSREKDSDVSVINDKDGWTEENQAENARAHFSITEILAGVPRPTATGAAHGATDKGTSGAHQRKKGATKR